MSVGVGVFGRPWSQPKFIDRVRLEQAIKARKLLESTPLSGWPDQRRLTMPWAD
jgi:hypothetical protein